MAQLGGLKLSRLMLGTVQFGLNYGIANKAGQPTYEVARDIIARAYDGGVTCLDTAALYGDSEDVLGRALSELQIADKMVVATKVCHLADDLSASEAGAIVEESVSCSLRRLRLDVLPICLFHNEDNFRYADSLLKLRDKGLVRCSGSSVNTPEAALRIVASGLADVVQMPTSVLDRRFVRIGVCEEAAKQGTTLFARSIYPQSLLLMPEEDILPDLAEVIPVRSSLQALARQAGMTISELAVRYVLRIPGIYASIMTPKSWERYSIHALEGIYPILGPGFISATNTGTMDRNIVHLKHQRGADVVVVAIYDMAGFGSMQLCGTQGYAHAAMSDTYYSFKSQLEAFVAYLRTGVRPFPFTETVELMKILIAGIKSREDGGREVLLSEISGD